jgi:hypothetical protein
MKVCLLMFDQEGKDASMTRQLRSQDLDYKHSTVKAGMDQEQCVNMLRILGVPRDSVEYAGSHRRWI